jgi:hypothetical protein
MLHVAIRFELCEPGLQILFGQLTALSMRGAVVPARPETRCGVGTVPGFMM